jgi:RimJ/RimL family protein N-acetyltransferase
MINHFRTKRTFLSKFSINDQDDLFRLEAQEKVMVYTGPGRAQSREESFKRLQRFVDHTPRIPIIDFFKVSLKADGRMIGFFAIFEHEGKLPEIGYILSPEFWGQGFAKEVAGYLCDLAINKFGIELLIGTCDKNNPSSIRVLEHCGFKQTRIEVIHNADLKRDIELIHFELT